MRIYKSINSWTEWPRPKKPELHWKAGRSAMELAKAFLPPNARGPKLPAALARLFRGAGRFANLVIDEGVPELLTDLPPHGAKGPRNHDMWLRGQSAGGLVGIGLEAKADESFDEVIGEKYRTALRKRGAKSSTRTPERFAAVTSLALGREVGAAELTECPLRYQLITGVAGTLLQSAREKRDIAAFVVYELASAITEERKRALNGRDYDAFARALPAAPTTASGLIGPIRYTANHVLPRDVEFWLGKVTQRV